MDPDLVATLLADNPNYQPSAQALQQPGPPPYAQPNMPATNSLQPQTTTALQPPNPNPKALSPPNQPNNYPSSANPTNTPNDNGNKYNVFNVRLGGLNGINMSSGPGGQSISLGGPGGINMSSGPAGQSMSLGGEEVGGWLFGDSESESEDERNSFVGVSINSGNNYTAFGNNFGNVGMPGRIVVNGRNLEQFLSRCGRLMW